MSIDKKIEQTTKITRKMEKQFIKDIEKAFVSANKEIKKKMADAFAKFSKDGKFDFDQFQKFNRLEKLQASIEAELKAINELKQQSVGKYLTDVYSVNYYGTGFALETEAQIKLSYSLLNRKQIAQSVLSPLDKIALQVNAEATRNAIRGAITSSIVQGEGIKDMAAKVSQALGKNANNAVRIARTETTGVMGRARQDSISHAENHGLELEKEWIATLDDRTRDSHDDIHGEVVPVDEPFSNGLQYPGDQSGPAEEVINCRCVMTTRLKGYKTPGAELRAESGKVIPYTDFDSWFKNRVKNSN